jgi:hypothetical protein
MNLSTDRPEVKLRFNRLGTFNVNVLRSAVISQAIAKVFNDRAGFLVCLRNLNELFGKHFRQVEYELAEQYVSP